MLERHIDLFKAPADNDIICITTNGMIKRNGCAVMGAGIAKAARDLFQGIDLILGQKLRESGNHVHHLLTSPKLYYSMNTVHAEPDVRIHVVSFPTKNDWRNDSDLSLIVQSCHELVDFCNQIHANHCYIPRPGCNNGHLDWETQVKPAISPILDDRFIVVYR